MRGVSRWDVYHLKLALLGATAQRCLARASVVWRGGCRVGPCFNLVGTYPGTDSNKVSSGLFYESLQTPFRFDSTDRSLNL